MPEVFGPIRIGVGAWKAACAAELSKIWKKLDTRVVQTHLCAANTLNGIEIVPDCRQSRAKSFRGGGKPEANSIRVNHILKVHFLKQIFSAPSTCFTFSGVEVAPIRPMRQTLSGRSRGDETHLFPCETGNWLLVEVSNLSLLTSTPTS